jgi:uncharacterized protein (DUF427 family)
MTKTITITPAAGTWVVRVGGAVLGESKSALYLEEDGYPAVIYFPREDLGMAFLEKTDHATTCPHKGAASYFSIVAKSTTYTNAAWSYESPVSDVAAIKDHIAFEVQEGITVEQV